MRRMHLNKVIIFKLICHILNLKSIYCLQNFELICKMQTKLKRRKLNYNSLQVGERINELICTPMLY